MIRRIVIGASLAAGLVVLPGCAWRANDKCYVPADTYGEMRELFVETGSMQRVEQVMEERALRPCERNQIRYQLKKDLYLDEVPEDMITGSVPQG